VRGDEDALTEAIVALATKYGRYGYRRITDLLQMAGWSVNAKRVQRIWRREGLKVPARQPKRGRLGLANGSCIRLRPQHGNHVWAYDFVSETTHDGRKLRLLTVIDEYTRECLAIRVARRITSHDVLYTLSELFLEARGPPEPARLVTRPRWHRCRGADAGGDSLPRTPVQRAVRGGVRPLPRRVACDDQAVAPMKGR
jgi:putative transposase